MPPVLSVSLCFGGETHRVTPAQDVSEWQHEQRRHGDGCYWYSDDECGAGPDEAARHVYGVDACEAGEEPRHGEGAFDGLQPLVAAHRRLCLLWRHGLIVTPRGVFRHPNLNLPRIDRPWGAMEVR